VEDEKEFWREFPSRQVERAKLPLRAPAVEDSPPEK
jgi:hypothetical protein